MNTARNMINQNTKGKKSTNYMYQLDYVFLYSKSDPSLSNLTCTENNCMKITEYANFCGFITISEILIFFDFVGTVELRI